MSDKLHNIGTIVVSLADAIKLTQFRLANIIFNRADLFEQVIYYGARLHCKQSRLVQE